MSVSGLYTLSKHMAHRPTDATRNLITGFLTTIETGTSKIRIKKMSCRYAISGEEGRIINQHSSYSQVSLVAQQINAST